MDDVILVCEGKRFKVLMTRGVAKEFEKVDAAQRARCQRWMKRFADDGHEYLDNEKFKHEGKFPTGDQAGTKVAIWAFKAWQVRVYGAIVKDAFIATEIDTSKKRNNADRGALESAAKKLRVYL